MKHDDSVFDWRSNGISDRKLDGAVGSKMVRIRLWWQCKVISTHPVGSQRNRDCPATDGNPSYPGYVSWGNNDPDRNYKGRKHMVSCHRFSGLRSRSRIRPDSWRGYRTTLRKCSILERRASCTSTCSN